MKRTLRITIFLAWAFLALIACAVPFVKTVMFVKICVAVLGAANVFGIIANIGLVHQLNKMDREAENGLQLQEKQD